MVRIIQKGNVRSENNFDVRITETDGKIYYYHFLRVEDGECAIHSYKPFNMKGVVEISWDELPIKFRETHLKYVYPNSTLSDYEKDCFLYGKEKVDEMRRIAAEKEEEKRQFIQSVIGNLPIDYVMTEVFFERIGTFNKVEAIYANWPQGKYIVDDKCIITTKGYDIVSIETKEEYDASRKNWGKRVSQIAKLAGTSFELATIVAEVPNVDEAVKILKMVNEILNSDKAISDLHYYSILNSRISYSIKALLSNRLPKEYTKKLNWNKKFYDSAEKILKSKK